MYQYLNEFLIDLFIRIAASCLALFVAVLLSWLCLRGMTLALELWLRIVKDLGRRKLTPEKLNLFFVLLFLIYTMFNSFQLTVDQVLNLPPSKNPDIDDSVYLFFLMLGSLMIAFCLEWKRENNKRNKRSSKMRKPSYNEGTDELMGN